MRKKSVYKRLEMLYKLLDEYDGKLSLEADPKRQMSMQNEIDKLNEQIEKAEGDFKQLG
jgi:predicted DNA-binding protein YlxM (UPF0122 family)